MTVSTTSSRIVLAGNGVTTLFPAGFRVEQASDLVVTYTDASGNDTVLTSGQYSTDGHFGSLWPNGPTVTYNPLSTPIAAGTTLTLQRVMAATQPTPLGNQGANWPVAIEGALDRLAMVQQDYLDTVSRSLTIAPTDGAALDALPVAVARAGKFLAFDSQGQPVAADGVTDIPSTTPIVETVATLALLKALVVRPATVFVQGKTAVNDGWGGTFVWLAGDSTTADDALVVQCTLGAAGRYKRLYDGIIDTRWFGAKCDSSPAGGGTDDTTAINAALAALTATGSALFQPGWSKISGALTLSQSNVEIFGSSPWGSGFVTTSGTANIFTCSAALSDVNFRNFGVWSTVAKSAGAAFLAPQATRFFFERVFIGEGTQAANDGMRLWRGIDMNGMDEFVMSACIVAGVQNEGIRACRDGVSGLYASELRIGGGSRFMLNDTHVLIGGGLGGIFFDDVSFNASRKHIVLNQTLTAQINREIFISSGANLDQCSDTCVEVGANGCAYLSIDNSWLAGAGQYGSPSGNQTNLYVDPTNAVLLLNIKDTKIFTAAGAGAIIGAGNVQADGVQCTDNGTFGIDLGANVTDFNMAGGRFGGNNNNTGGDLRIHASIANYNISGVVFYSPTKLVNTAVYSTTKLIRNCTGIADTGTWTPVIAGSTTPGTQTYSTQTGHWARVGNWVFLTYNITLTAVGGTIAGNVTITGLPITAAAENWPGSASTIGSIAHAANMTQFGLRTASTGAAIQLVEFVDSGASNVAGFVPVTALAVGSTIIGSLMYQAA